MRARAYKEEKDIDARTRIEIFRALFRILPSLTRKTCQWCQWVMTEGWPPSGLGGSEGNINLGRT
jgi:hypothetical protein